MATSTVKNITCIIGTRPEVIKMAPVIRALREEPRFRLTVLCSGQHRDLLAPLLTDNAYHEIMARGGSPYGDGRAAERIAQILRDHL